MSVTILVCACGKRVRAPGARPGRVGRCPACGRSLKAPAATGVPAQPETGAKVAAGTRHGRACHGILKTQLGPEVTCLSPRSGLRSVRLASSGGYHPRRLRGRRQVVKSSHPEPSTEHQWLMGSWRRLLVLTDRSGHPSFTRFEVLKRSPWSRSWARFSGSSPFLFRSIALASGMMRTRLELHPWGCWSS